MAAVDQLQNICRPFSIALALCVLSFCTVQANSQHNFPSEHGLTYAKNPGEASPEMIAFFSQPKAELPEGRDVSDPVWRAAAKSVPADPVNNGGHRRPALLIAGIVFAVLGAGLLVTALVAYMLHARRSRAWSSSSSLVGLTRWRNDPAVQLGAV